MRFPQFYLQYDKSRNALKLLMISIRMDERKSLHGFI